MKEVYFCWNWNLSAPVSSLHAVLRILLSFDIYMCAPAEGAHSMALLQERKDGNPHLHSVRDNGKSIAP